MKKNMKQNIEALYFTIMGFSSYSCSDALHKSLSTTYPFQNNLFFASSFSLCFLVLISPFFGGLFSCLKTKKIKMHLLRALLCVPQGLFCIYAFANLPLAKVYPLLFLSPLLSAFLAAFLLKEKADLYKIIPIFSGFLGVIVILRPGIIPITLPMFAAICSTFFFSLITITVRKMGDKEHMFAYAFYPVLVMIMVTFAITLPQFIWPTPKHLMVLAVTGAAAANGGMCISRGFSMARTSLVAPIHYIQIIWGAVFGYIFFGDLIDIYTAIGSAIIVGSGLFLIYKDKETSEEIRKTREKGSSFPLPQ